MRLNLVFPPRLQASKGFRVGDGVAQYDDSRFEQCVVLRRGGVGKLKAVRTVVEAYIERELLVEITEDRELGAGQGVTLGAECKTAGSFLV